MRHLVLARAVDRRLAIVREILATADGGDIVVIGATRGAADDFVRSIARTCPATFGMHRFSLPQLASRVARLDAARDGLSPAPSLMIDALAAHASHAQAEAGALPYFAPVAHLPGFPHAVRRSITELRLADVALDAVRRLPTVGPDLHALLRGYEDALTEFGVSDVADLYGRAVRVLQEDAPSFLTSTVVFLDVAPGAPATERFIAALADVARVCIATTPAEDERTCAFFRSHEFVANEDVAPIGTALDRLREHLFAIDVPQGISDDTVRFFSAPGEGREAVEIARAVAAEARRGVPFDEIAVLLRNPASYTAHLASAFRRAGIPVYIAHGARRPDPSGRAFLALLACGAENLSARRFAEYLSLGQVPLVADERATAAHPEEDVLVGALGTSEPAATEDNEEAALREPWKWEEMIIEAAVLGGADRWERRLLGLEREHAARLRRMLADDPATSRAEALRRDIKRLAELRAFAIPVISALQELAQSRTWRAWLDGLEALARKTLKSPRRVLRALADLRPMGEVGPVTYADVLAVLTDRLRTLEREQEPTRFGRVFVAPLDYARGRTFRMVFIPGVAERVFPKRLREDPLLLDRVRAEFGSLLDVQTDRAVHERLLLQVAIGAASERLTLSYPRMEIREGRPRVSSFYALDVVRAVNGGIPDYEAVEAAAWEEAGATMAWPAPVEPADAIDALEYDLAALKPLLTAPDPDSVRGRANYLVRLHAMLGRALRTRRARWHTSWSGVDGFIAPPAAAEHAALAAHRLHVQPYSPSSLQLFAACPYRFYLSAILRLRTREEPERIEALDALTRGTLIHEIYAAVLRRLRVDGFLPLLPERLHEGRVTADAVLNDVARRAYDDLAPAIDLVWETAIATIRTDMHIWLGEIAAASDAWIPAHFELAFGVDDTAAYDPASVTTPVVMPQEGFQFRGSIDLVEHAAHSAQIRIRDYKTGADPVTKLTLVVGAGEVLQPTLYAHAAEQVLGRNAVEGQLWYATARGGFKERVVPIDNASRASMRTVLQTIDAAVQRGDMPAAPRKDACRNCEFIRVCGPYEEIRVGRKTHDRTGNLARIRGLA